MSKEKQIGTLLSNEVMQEIFKSLERQGMSAFSCVTLTDIVVSQDFASELFWRC